MSTVQDVIDDVRLELRDDAGTWNDTTLVAFVSKAVRRANHILYRNDIDFGRQYTEFPTVAGTTQYALPADFMSPYGLFRRDRNLPLRQVDDDQWEHILSAAESTVWRIYGSNIEILGEPVQAITLRFYYWPKVDTSAYTVSTTMPWDGRLDDAIMEYVAFRCRNIDEMATGLDSELMQEFERNILNTYQGRQASLSVVSGWAPYGCR